MCEVNLSQLENRELTKFISLIHSRVMLLRRSSLYGFLAIYANVSFHQRE